jgi:hypothetical protein
MSILALSPLGSTRLSRSPPSWSCCAPRSSAARCCPRPAAACPPPSWPPTPWCSQVGHLLHPKPVARCSGRRHCVARVGCSAASWLAASGGSLLPPASVCCQVRLLGPASCLSGGPGGLTYSAGWKWKCSSTPGIDDRTAVCPHQSRVAVSSGLKMPGVCGRSRGWRPQQKLCRPSQLQRHVQTS